MEKPYSIIYSPWREKYANIINTENPNDLLNKSCVFCNIVNHKNNTSDFILHKGKNSLIKLASQPYVNNGIHFLIIPYKHIRETSDLSATTYKETNILTQKLCALFSHDCYEIYINTNQGTSAGASIPDHYHRHIIINKSPRYYNLIDAIKETKTTINLPLLFQILQPKIITLNDITVPSTSKKLH